MLDKDIVYVSAPSGPYPKCEAMSCGGTMLPIVEPATGRSSFAPGEFWVQGTAVLKWKCGKCGAIVR